MDRIEYLKAVQWPGTHADLLDREGQDFFLPSSPDEAWSEVRAADPTPNGRYLSWILSILRKGGLRSEDLGRVPEALALFDRVKRRLPAPGRDISNYGSEAALWQALRPLAASRGSNEIRREEFQAILGQTVVHYDGPEGLVVTPLTAEASAYWGRGTRWCTASSVRNAFDHYAKNGPLVIAVPRGSPRKHQVHAWSRSLMDDDDRPVDPRPLLEAEPWLRSARPFVLGCITMDARVARLVQPQSEEDWLAYADANPAVVVPGILEGRPPPSAIRQAGCDNPLLAALCLVKAYGRSALDPAKLSLGEGLLRFARLETSPDGNRYLFSFPDGTDMAGQCASTLLNWMFGSGHHDRVWQGREAEVFVVPDGSSVAVNRSLVDIASRHEDVHVRSQLRGFTYERVAITPVGVSLPAVRDVDLAWYARNAGLVHRWPSLRRSALRLMDRRMIEELGFDPAAIRRELGAEVHARPEIVCEWPGLPLAAASRLFVVAFRPDLVGRLKGPFRQDEVDILSLKLGSPGCLSPGIVRRILPKVPPLKKLWALAAHPWAVNRLGLLPKERAAAAVRHPACVRYMKSPAATSLEWRMAIWSRPDIVLAAGRTPGSDGLSPRSWSSNELRLAVQASIRRHLASIGFERWNRQSGSAQMTDPAFVVNESVRFAVEAGGKTYDFGVDPVVVRLAGQAAVEQVLATLAARIASGRATFNTLADAAFERQLRMNETASGVLHGYVIRSMEGAMVLDFDDMREDRPWASP